MAESEIEALKAIYCEDGEVNVLQEGWNQESDTIFCMKIVCNSQHCEELMEQSKLNTVVQVTFTLPADYPNCIPGVSLQCSTLVRENIANMKRDIQKYAESFIQQPMIMELVIWIQQNALHYTQAKNPQMDKVNKERIIPSHQHYLAEHSGDGESFTALLHLDHMRAKAKYVKTIQKWAEELGLSGRLIFLEKLILILLQGDEADIKNYISRQRTVNVDVDSKGRSCKERMLSVLANSRTTSNLCRFQDFQVAELNSAEELHDIFMEHGLSTLYESNVRILLKR